MPIINGGDDVGIDDISELINYDDSNLYPYGGSVEDKWDIFKSSKGRQIFISDNDYWPDDPNNLSIHGEIKEDLEKIGLIGELKTHLPPLPDEPIDELNLYKNRNVILIDETRNNESILIKTHKLDYIFIDITNRKLQIRFKDDIEIETGHNLNLKVANDMNVEIGNNLNMHIGNDFNQTTGHDKLMNIGHDYTKSIGNDRLINVGHNYTTNVDNDKHLNVDNDTWASIGRDTHVDTGRDTWRHIFRDTWRWVERDSYYKFCGRGYSTRCDKPQLALDPAGHPQGNRN